MLEMLLLLYLGVSWTLTFFVGVILWSSTYFGGRARLAGKIWEMNRKSRIEKEERSKRKILF